MTGYDDVLEPMGEALGKAVCEPTNVDDAEILLSVDVTSLCVAGLVNSGRVLADGDVFGGTEYFVSDLGYTVLEVLRTRSASVEPIRRASGQNSVVQPRLGDVDASGSQ